MMRQKKPKKKKKTSDEAPALDAGAEEAAVPVDDAALKTGTAGTEEAEQPQLSQLDLGLKRACLAKKVAERTKVTAAGHFFHFTRISSARCTVPMGQNCDVTSRHSPMD